MTGSLYCFTASLMRLSSGLGRLIGFSRCSYPTLRPTKSKFRAVYFFIARAAGSSWRGMGAPQWRGSPAGRAISSRTLLFVFDFSHLPDGHLPITIRNMPSSVTISPPRTSLT
jgi:hypothetical protein